ncbi:MAG: DUF72 domain-containing protein [Cytophagales bacterium]|nr:MAG: DUF72 domain-containing protein [Cytophagales bacterium]
MEFGKITNFSQVDFTLPAENITFLEGKKSHPAMQIYVGCPIWNHKAWIGHLYPKNAKEKDFLHHYSQQFNTIELNLTHYRIPDLDTVHKWHSQTQPHFTFCPKIPQEISHQQLLRGDFQNLSQLFFDNMSYLGEKIGMYFLQLPPYFEPRHLSLLEDFLAYQAHWKTPIAVEFRHENFFKSLQFQKAIDLLQRYEATALMTDVAGRRDVLHMHLSTATLMLRFVGNNLHQTDYERIDQWTEKIDQWQKKGLESIYFFAHEPENTLAPTLADYFIEQLQKKEIQTTPQRPQFQQNFIQKSLF